MSLPAQCQQNAPPSGHSIFTATGPTYKFRYDLISHGWKWNSVTRMWILTNGSDYDSPAVYFAQRIPGVIVKEEYPVWQM